MIFEGLEGFLLLKSLHDELVDLLLLVSLHMVEGLFQLDIHSLVVVTVGSVTVNSEAGVDELTFDHLLGGGHLSGLLFSSHLLLKADASFDLKGVSPRLLEGDDVLVVLDQILDKDGIYSLLSGHLGGLGRNSLLSAGLHLL